MARPRGPSRRQPGRGAPALPAAGVAADRAGGVGEGTVGGACASPPIAIRGRVDSGEAEDVAEAPEGDTEPSRGARYGSDEYF